jgi:oligosaccharide repeat unit polymerase
MELAASDRLALNAPPLPAIPRERRGYVNLLLTGIVAVGLALVLPALLYVSGGKSHLTGAGLFAWIITAYSAVRLAGLVWDGRPRLLEMTFWIYVYIWLGMAGMLQLTSGSFPWRSVHSPGSVLVGLAIIAVGLFAYEVGLRAPRVRRSRHAPRITPNARFIDPYRVVAMAVFATVAVAYLLFTLGGVAALMVSRQELSGTLARLSGGSGKVIGMATAAMLKIPPFVALVALWTSWLHRRTQVRSGHWLLWPILVLAVVNVIVNNPFSSTRAWFGTVVLTFLLISFRWRRRYSMTIWVAALVGLFIVVFPYADLFRYQVALKIDAPNHASLGEQFVKNGDYASFQQVLNAVTFTEVNGHTLGRQFLGAVFVWVPRRIWTSKPIDTGDLVAIFAGYPFTNLEMPLWAELYVDWQVPGVILGLFAYGWITSALQRDYLRNASPATSFRNLAMPILAGYQLFLIRGDLMSSLAWFVVTLGCLLLVTTNRAGLTGARPS